MILFTNIIILMPTAIIDEQGRGSVQASAGGLVSHSQPDERTGQRAASAQQW